MEVDNGLYVASVPCPTKERMAIESNLICLMQLLEK
jgi:hypothetical protein